MSCKLEHLKQVRFKEVIQSALEKNQEWLRPNKIPNNIAHVYLDSHVDI